MIVEGTRKHRVYRWTSWLLGATLVVLLAFAIADTAQLSLFGNHYNLGLPRLSKSIAFMIAILGLQLIVGYTGQLALGQSFFFGTGAYVSAYLVQDLHWPWLATLPVVVLVCLLIGVAIGIPVLRIKGLYLALVTLGLAAVFPAIVQLDVLDRFTDGARGKIVDSDIVAPGWLPLDGLANLLQGIPLVGHYFGEGDLTSREADRIWAYLLFVGFASLCFWLVANLINSRQGRALRAIRDNETSAAMAGIRLSYYKVISFGLASALGGLGGVVYVAEVGIASPGDFTQLLAILFIVGLVVGGVGTLPGAVVGGLAVAFVPEWSSSTTELPGVPERWLQGPTGTLILGVLLIALTFLMPGGVVSGIRRLKGRLICVEPALLSASSGPNGYPSLGLATVGARESR